MCHAGRGCLREICSRVGCPLGVLSCLLGFVVKIFLHRGLPRRGGLFSGGFVIGGFVREVLVHGWILHAGELFPRFIENMRLVKDIGTRSKYRHFSRQLLI